jgi:ankyrin repeat protein
MTTPIKYMAICGIALSAVALFLVGHALFERHKITQLRILIQRGDAAGASRLIEQDPRLLAADLGERHGDNLKSLSVAASLGKEYICSNLIRLGADVNERDKYGYTPLHYAAMADQTNIAVLLIKQKADLALKDFEGMTPLDLAGKFNASSNLIRILTAGSGSSGNPPVLDIGN